jgi:succinate dehydrogenase/fumarate reductase flavoprotein subunit
VKKNESNSDPSKTGEISRRDFIKGAAALGAVAAVGSILPLSAEEQTAPYAVDTNSSATVPVPPTPGSTVNQIELAIPAVTDVPKTTKYECDVLVLGCGFAGLNAAVAAKKAGKSVILVDKGRPGYSGLAPFASSHRWFDPEMGDSVDAFRQYEMIGGEYICNLSWYDIWIKDSKAAYQRLMNWGILTQFDKASIAGAYVEKKDYVGYREKFDQYDRRKKFIKVLTDNKIDYVENTMITDVIQQDGTVIGGMGFDVRTGTVMTFVAKAVVMCMGGGSYKPSGFPTSTDTFDAEYIGYNLGLPIIGKEFDDFHMTVSYAAGNTFLNDTWTYLENIWLCGGDAVPGKAKEIATVKEKAMLLDRLNKAVNGLPNNDGTEMEVLAKADVSRRGGSLSKNPLDPRKGKNNDDMPKGDTYGAAIGMCAHLTSGIFCGIDDLVGYTGVPGLYVAGDGSNGSLVSGAAYPCGVGFTSNFCSIQGWRAGEAAAEYASSAKLVLPSLSKISSITKDILAPTVLKTGFDANWARDELQAIMSPYWIHIAKTESTLQGALAQVQYMRDNVVPKLMAPSSHDLRLCHEVRHKVLSAEMKLRASLARKESRGYHYRTDYPYRDDKNFLCYISVKKDKSGYMGTALVPIKDEWKGNTAEAYASRYGCRFPGETEAMGLSVTKE